MFHPPIDPKEARAIMIRSQIAYAQTAYWATKKSPSARECLPTSARCDKSQQTPSAKIRLGALSIRTSMGWRTRAR